MVPIPVDDPHTDDRRRPVEEVELRRVQPLGGDQANPDEGLGDDRQLGRRRPPPKGPPPQGSAAVGAQRPQSGHRVAQHRYPGQGLVNIAD